MDIEQFSGEQLQEELLKIVDEMYNRDIDRDTIIDIIDNGKRN